MGKSVKIVDLAVKMIRLSGLRPYEDVDIVFTGLRQGEKLYEELLSTEENSLPTHHEKIMVARERKDDYVTIQEKVKELVNEAHSVNPDEMSMVRKMKDLVPEYLSNSSRFEILDQVSVSDD